MDKDNIRISIITATYNGKSTIEQTICSVLNQSYTNIEYIVVDGESTDGTVDILRKYSAKIKWISEKDNGLYDALNKALALSTGDYIQVLGDDDCLTERSTVKKIVSFIQNHNTDFVCSNRIVVDEQSHMEYVEQSNINVVNKDSRNLFWTPHTGLYVKGDLMRKEKFNTNFRMGADYYLILKYFYKEKSSFSFYDYASAYFANSGVSSNEEEYKKENIRICTALKIEQKNINSPKNIAKKIIKLTPVYNIYRRRRKKIHICDNPYCRWCGRFNELV